MPSLRGENYTQTPTVRIVPSNSIEFVSPDVPANLVNGQVVSYTFKDGGEGILPFFIQQPRDAFSVLFDLSCTGYLNENDEKDAKILSTLITKK